MTEERKPRVHSTLLDMLIEVASKEPMPDCAKFTLIVRSPAGVAVGEANAVLEVVRADTEGEFMKGMLLHLANQCRSVL